VKGPHRHLSLDRILIRFIVAYVESLRLNASSEELEVLMRRILSCPRDLPSFYACTAVSLGGKAHRPHSRDPLVVRGRALSSNYFLTTLKRIVNGAMAGILLEQCQLPSANATEYWESRLMTAYICFLRLNMTLEELVTNNTWSYNRIENSEASTILNAIVQLYRQPCVPRDSIPPPSCWSNDYLGIQALREALQFCQTRFSNLSSTMRSKPKSKPKPTVANGSEESTN
jgi:hypothetical protein